MAACENRIKLFQLFVLLILVVLCSVMVWVRWPYYTTFVTSFNFSSNILEPPKEARIHYEVETSENSSVLPQKLVHRMLHIQPSSTLQDVENKTALKLVEPGGAYLPGYCTSRERVAIIVPYRDRKQHLSIFLAHMHNILQRQDRCYTIFIVELAMPSTFNRGLLANVGFVAANMTGNFTCFIVHDVDLLVADDRNIYRCSNSIDMIRHMSVSVSKLNYRLPYASIVGGVTAIRKEQFQAVNGYSNIYFGWGGEDDDFYKRFHSHKYDIERPSVTIGRYEALPHSSDKHNKPNPNRFRYLQNWWKRARKDGLNSLPNYTDFTTEKRPLYTWVNVTVDEVALKKAFPL